MMKAEREAEPEAWHARGGYKAGKLTGMCPPRSEIGGLWELSDCKKGGLWELNHCKKWGLWELSAKKGVFGS